MRQVLLWLTIVFLCGAAGTAAGEEPPDARLQEAQAAFDEAMKLRGTGAYAGALVKGNHALALWEAVLGGSHLEVAKCLNLLGVLHILQGDLAGAEPLLQRGLKIREAALDKDHPDVASSLNNLANLYTEQGLYDRAEPLYERVLAIREAAAGKNDPSVAATLNNLANLYKARAWYTHAKPLYERSLAIRESALGKEHPAVAQSMSNLALCYTGLGMYSRAEPLYERVLAIYEKAHGKSHPDVAGALNNLASHYIDRGMYVRAEPLYTRAITIWEESLGKDHPSVASAITNLAILYKLQGFYDRAEPLYARAIAIKEAALGQVHPEVASSLDSLADLYTLKGWYDRARQLFERAIAIEEAALGKNHPELARSLNNLAALYKDQGLYDRAKPLYERAASIKEAALGKSHPDVASSLNNLAEIYWHQGLYRRAEPLYARSRSIWEAALDPNHPYIAESLTNLARLRLAQQRLADAVPLFTRAFTISERRLRQEALDFSEPRLASLLRLLRQDEERLYALLRAHPADASVRRLALSAVLLLKGRSVEETADISRTIYGGLGAQDRETFEHLRSLRTQLAALSFEGPGSLPLADYQQRLKQLSEQGEALEANLATRSAPLRALTALPSPANVAERVAAALPKDSALIEFIAYTDRPLVPKPNTPKARLPSQPRYLALVLFPEGHTRALDLGPAEPIDLAATRLRDALANRDAAFQPLAQELYRVAFQPLLPLLGNTRRLFLSPDGQLGLVPFAALHDGQNFLIDSFDFTYLTSGKDLLPRPQEVAPSSTVVVFADPDFSAPHPSSPSTARSEPVQTERSAPLERFFSTLRADLAERPWVRLPGTRQEAEAIQRRIPQAQLFLGSEATRDRLVHLPTPGILHLATHGFFLEDAPALPASRAVGHFGALGTAPGAPRPPDPLLRSGLVLASARPPATEASNTAGHQADSALVTALELAGLNLWGTQLVVLSACDTGRGEVRLGQGVYGLRRAFVTAGAETVVMSLWKVNDNTTRLLMDAYYGHLLAGQGRATALREAMRTSRQSQPHPHYWAPFIVLGWDGPLRSLAPLPPGTPAP
jgi:CHAT domain-containing protein/Tfp pilus assembly protein PilF